jgi:hypothetical protein
MTGMIETIVKQFSDLKINKMNMIKKLKEWYQNFNTAKWNTLCKKYFPEQKHVIEFAFEVAGVKYFRFNDVFTLPYERGLMSIAIYEETRMKCSREYLMEHCSAVSEILRNPKTVDIFRINELNEQMKSRLELTMDVDLLYKLASVAFFDKNENPVLYDAEYNVKKIAFWKKHKGVADFFLQKPVAELMPFIRNSNIDLDAYSVLNEKLNELHLGRIRDLNSKKQ